MAKFGNKVPKIIFQTNGEKVAGRLIKLSNEFHNLYCTSNIIQVMKVRRCN
jgi:hypothetical protein